MSEENLHLDDVDAQSRMSKGIWPSPPLPSAKEKENSSSRSRDESNQHVKLIKQYLSTCKQSGHCCAIDKILPSELSECCDGTSIRTSPRKICNVANLRLDTVVESPSRSIPGRREVSDRRSSQKTISNCRFKTVRTLSVHEMKGSDDLSSHPTPPPCIVHDQDASSVYKAQLAAALSAGRDVWL